MSEPGEPEIIVQLPEAECAEGQSCFFDFGPILLGDARTVAFDVVNIGDDDTIVSITSDDPQFTIGQVSEPVRVEVSLPFLVRAAPARPEPVAGNLVVEWGKVEAKQNVVELRALGVSPGLVANPAECDFGALPIGESRVCEITLSNTSVSEVTVDAMTVAPGAFDIENEQQLPLVVQPATVVAVQIRGTAEAGRVEGALSYRVGTTEFPDAVTLAIEGN